MGTGDGEQGGGMEMEIEVCDGGMDEEWIKIIIGQR